MKSNRSSEFLALHVNRVGYVHYADAIQAVEIAEEEVLTRAYEQLTSWKDPKKELPESGKHVLVKRINGGYDVDLYDSLNKRFLLATTVPMAVMAWRYIHE